MTNLLEQLVKQSALLHDRFIQHNNELDQAFQLGTLGEFLGEDDDNINMEPKTGTDDMARQDGRTGREPAARKTQVRQR